MFTSRACCSYTYMRRAPLRQLSTTTATKPKKDNNHRHKYILAGVVSTTLISASVYTRHVCDEKLSHLVLAKDCGHLSTDVDNEDSPPSYQYNLPYIIEQVTRAGLVGTTKSVKDELQYIRKWHIEKGYYGGIVLRDVTIPALCFRYQNLWGLIQVTVRKRISTILLQKIQSILSIQTDANATIYTTRYTAMDKQNNKSSVEEQRSSMMS